MKTTAIGMMGVLVLAGALFAQKAPGFSVRNEETFTGKITDSYCAQDKHIGLVKGERNCILTCVKLDGAEFVLFNPRTQQVYKLDDQAKPEAFAGDEVTITGKYDAYTKTIHVSEIKPKIIETGS